MEMSFRILQTNLEDPAQHKVAVAKQMIVCIILVCGQNKNLTEGSEWVKDSKVDVVVLFVNKKVIATNASVRNDTQVCVSAYKTVMNTVAIHPKYNDRQICGKH